MRLLVIALVVLFGSIAWRSGILAQFEDIDHARRALVDLGVWGYLAFVVAYSLLQPFGVPGTLFVVVAPLVWPWPVAFVLSMIGTMGASVVGFSFARFIARDWLAARLPARLRRWEDALDRNAFRTVVVLRLLLWMPQALHAFLGVSRIGFWTHFWGSLVGYVLPLLAVSYFGPKAFETLQAFGLREWVILASITAAASLVIWQRRRAARRGAAPPPSATAR